MFRKNRPGSKTGRPPGTNTFFTFFLKIIFAFYCYKCRLDIASEILDSLQFLQGRLITFSLSLFGTEKMRIFTGFYFNLS
jgi:hypothetical protein